ncbi:ARS-binding protein [Fusarium heterosporum]|uniref:ARS-binding protein n=1 Tax=Fusarium heterosporum TaxID=42747 RepID=A0A8H5TV21_FUSHE|nr:ARS-binding protein [Fusarium heterosporum]
MSSSPANHASRPAPAQPPPQPGASGAGSAAPPDLTLNARRDLPDRSVSEESIENAYVDFVLFCNPAVPLDTDTASLREAFRNPPRSGGKSFSTFAIYELVHKFYDSEIRTWTELTTTLGVEPPDPSKEESAQKVAQYGVRLKKWMNSMHVKAFFEYLMDIPNDYWTNIPTDNNPTSQAIRDGVALEDDMALRALFPHIRPKRGRKRPVEDDMASATSTATSPAQTQTQRSHLAPSSALDAVSAPMSADPSRLSGAPWTPSDGAHQTSLFRWPQSAITPNSRKSFWDDALEPQSAVTPSKPRLTALRRGPKNVSSAWRPGVANGGVKPRGRPPMNRTPIDVSHPPFSFGVTAPVPVNTPPVLDPAGSDNSTGPDTTPIPPIISQPHPASTRGPRPSISLQVPDRPSGSVRLATPPPPTFPAVILNGHHSESQAQLHASYCSATSSIAKTTDEAGAASQQRVENPMSEPKDVPRLFFERIEDRTNIDELIGYLMRNCLTGNWLDEEGNPTHTCSTPEAMAFLNSILEDMYKTAVSPETFLINLAAMSGGGYLLAGPLTFRRCGVKGDARKYICEWEYRLGHIRGQYQMEAMVPLEMLEMDDASPESKLSAEEWQTKYENLLMEMDRRDRKFVDLSTKVRDLLKRPPKK